MNERTIPTLAKVQQHSPHVAVGYLQPLGRGYLRPMLLIYFVQNVQSIPFPLIQSDSLRFHRPLGHPWNRTFLLCTNRTFSFRADIQLRFLDLYGNAPYDFSPRMLLPLASIYEPPHTHFRRLGDFKRTARSNL